MPILRKHHIRKTNRKGHLKVQEGYFGQLCTYSASVNASGRISGFNAGIESCTSSPSKKSIDRLS
eukprot:gene11752-biopygen16100